MQGNLLLPALPEAAKGAIRKEREKAKSRAFAAFMRKADALERIANSGTKAPSRQESW